MNIYPAIDLKDGEVVRLQRGDFSKATVYHQDPMAMAQHFASQGAKYLHIVDLSGALHPASHQAELIKRISASTPLKVQVGGGVRALEQVKGYLDAGVERVVIGSLAVENPELTRLIFKEFGGRCITLAIDVAAEDDLRISIKAWQDLSSQTAFDLIDSFVNEGLEQLLCTDIRKDGMMQGPSVGLYELLQKRYPSLHFMASGGVRNLDDIRELKVAGVKSVIVGKALYEGKLDLKEALQC